MKFARMLALSVALVLVAGELGQLALAHEKQTLSVVPVATTQKKPVKVKRTIRLKESPPAPVVETVEALKEKAKAPEPAPEEPAGKVALNNAGHTNAVDVQPNISIGSPTPPPTPQQQQQPKQVEPSPSPATEVRASPPVVQSQGMANSNNLVANLVEGNNNSRQTVVRNSGNNEQVHIDGVGNQKVTHISNANNREHRTMNDVGNQQPHQQTPAPCNKHPQSNHVAHPGNQNLPALIQINMNEGPGQSRPPMMVLHNGGWPMTPPEFIPPGYVRPAVRQMAPQRVMAGAAPAGQAAPAPALVMAPLPAMMMPPPPPFMMPPPPPFMMPPPPPGMMMPAPMMMPPPPPFMMPPPGMMMPPPPFMMMMPPQPAMWPGAPGPLVSQSRAAVREARRARKSVKKLKKSMKKMERRQKRKDKSSESDKPALAQVAPTEPAESNDKRKEVKQPAPAAVASEPAAPETPEAEPLEPADEAEEEPQEQEQEPEEEEPAKEDIEWETIRVPKRRKPLKRARTLADEVSRLSPSEALAAVPAASGAIKTLAQPLGGAATAGPLSLMPGQ